MKKKLRISQCMIVKNEENNIERALSWGRNIVWEQIVVDTGSTDRTVELASAMGAQIYHIPWEDDFAAAKNFAISKAKGEWIAFLDADEEFAPGDGKKLLRMLEEIDHRGMDGVAAGWMQLDDEGKVFTAGTQIRVFRNCPGLGYRRRIHEQLEWSDKRAMRVQDATKELSILHRGYCGQAWKEKKLSQRNLKLIRKELEDHPEDYEMMGYLGDVFSAAEEWDEAEKWYRRSIDFMPSALDENDQRSASTFLHLMEIINRNPEDNPEIVPLYEKAVRLLPKEADFDYVIGRYFVGRKAYKEGLLYLGRAFEKLEKYGSYNKAMLLIGNLKEAYESQALCFLMSGQVDKAVSSSVAVLKTDPYSVQALYVLLKAFKGEAEGVSISPADTLGFLRKIYNFDSLRDRLLILRISEEAGWAELYQLVEQTFSDDELSVIRK